MNPLEFSSQDPSQISRLAAHGFLVDRHELLQRLECHVFGKILNHSKNTLIQRSINLTGVLNLLQKQKNNERKKEEKNQNMVRVRTIKEQKVEIIKLVLLT